MRVANQLCPVCFKVFAVDTWLDRHIAREHPVYLAEATARKRQLRQSNPYDEQPSKHEQPLAPRSAFFLNHDNVYDPDAFGKVVVQTEASNLPLKPPSPQPEDMSTTYTYPAAGLSCAYVPLVDEFTSS